MSNTYWVELPLTLHPNLADIGSNSYRSARRRYTLNKQVDLVEDGRVLPFASDSVYQDKILIYEG